VQSYDIEFKNYGSLQNINYQLKNQSFYLEN
jgi:hypothetical protein